MAAYKETPRQKMIAMMYLVLTALLALNVSKEVIDAFAVVNESLEQTNREYDSKINQTYRAFENQYKLNKEKVGEYWERAKKARKYSNEMKQYLADARDTVIVKTEGGTIESIKRKIATDADDIESPDEIKEIPLNYLASKDNYDTPTNYFVPNTGKSRSKGKAQEIRKEFIDYREKMKSLLAPADRGDISIGPDFDATYRDASGKKEDWETHNFYHTIMAASVTILNKLIAEVNNAEFEVINYLYSRISKEDFKFTNIEAKVIPDRKYVLQGENYTADVIVAAYDTTQRPEVFIQHGVDSITNIDNATKLDTQDDIVNLDFPATEVGKHSYAGLLRIQQPSGMYEKHYFSNTYNVGRKTATVSADKMNVFYKGVKNPVSISVPGVASHNVSPRINVGTISDKGDGKYVVDIPGDASQRKATISVNALMEGQESEFASFDFRVREIPDPIPTVGGMYSSGEVERSTIRASSIIAKMPDYFEFDYFFPVQSFVMVFRGPDGYSVELESNTNQFTPRMLDRIENLEIGSRITFEQIVVKAPEGQRTLESVISIKIG